jgi:hypothetical protein
MSLQRLAALLLLTAPLLLCSCADVAPPANPPNNPPQQGGVRAPTFQYVKKHEGGCHDLYLYKGSDDRREFLLVWADKKKLDLPEKGSKTFDLANAPKELKVTIDLWNRATERYCNDFTTAGTKIEATWKAVKGKITITLHGPGEMLKEGGRILPRASVRLEGVVFDDGAGHQATLKEETLTEVPYGWIPG